MHTQSHSHKERALKKKKEEEEEEKLLFSLFFPTWIGLGWVL